MSWPFIGPEAFYSLLLTQEEKRFLLKEWEEKWKNHYGVLFLHSHENTLDNQEILEEIFGEEQDVELSLMNKDWLSSLKAALTTDNPFTNKPSTLNLNSQEKIIWDSIFDDGDFNKAEIEKLINSNRSDPREDINMFFESFSQASENLMENSQNEKAYLRKLMIPYALGYINDPLLRQLVPDEMDVLFLEDYKECAQMFLVVQEDLQAQRLHKIKDQNPPIVLIQEEDEAIFSFKDPSFFYKNLNQEIALYPQIW